jgi:hypothetical protein
MQRKRRQGVLGARANEIPLTPVRLHGCKVTLAALVRSTCEQLRRGYVRWACGSVPGGLHHEYSLAAAPEGVWLLNRTRADTTCAGYLRTTGKKRTFKLKADS